MLIYSLTIMVLAVVSKFSEAALSLAVKVPI
jgi:hypothetical protein